MIKELCVDGLEQAIKASEMGADRIEFCKDLSVGGITPDLEEIQQYSCPTKTVVMIRCRAGDFVYNDQEIDQMIETINQLKQMNHPQVEGIVLGFLTPENLIDQEQMKKVMEIAAPLYVVFHMAFDEIPLEHQLSQL